jgi:hypothetical protein
MDGPALLNAPHELPEEKTQGRSSVRFCRRAASGIMSANPAVPKAPESIPGIGLKPQGGRKMKRSVLLGMIAMLLVTALACSAFSGGGGGSSTSGVDIKIVNRSPDEICYVLISPSESDSWGEDQLGDQDTIKPGSNQTFSMPDDTYDVRVETCDEAAMATAWEVSDDMTLNVGDSGSRVRLLISNSSDTEVCYVFISPSSGDEWGEDWMGDLESLPPDGLRVFYVKSDIYDLQAADCDGDTLTEEYEVDLTEDLTWTLNN